MKIWTLMENTACPGFCAEHGLSLYIETGDLRILFDAGQSGAFADNASRLGIDLCKVDFAVLSHGHYDHGGGLSRFLEINHHAGIYVSRHAFGPHYNASGKYIGLDSGLQESPQLVYTDGKTQIAPGVVLCNPTHWIPDATGGLLRKEKDCFVDEDYRHEQYLLIREGERLFCFSGCAHRGVVQIARAFRPDVMVGGFHFKDIPPDSPQLSLAARELLALPATYYTGHCTGEQQFVMLKKVMGHRLVALHSGAVCEL